MFKLDPRRAVIEHIQNAESSEGSGQLSPKAEAIARELIEPGFSHSIVVGMAQAVEALMLLGLGIAIYLIYVGPHDLHFYLPLATGAVFAANISFNIARTHRIPAYRTTVDQTVRVLAGWSAVFLLLFAVLFVFQAGDMVSRVWVGSWYATGVVALLAYRLGLRALVLRWSEEGRLKRRTVIVGGGDDARALIDKIDASPSSDLQLIGLFDDRSGYRSPEMIGTYPKLGKVDDLIEFSRRAKIDLVIVSMPLSAETRVLEMLRKLWVLPVDIRLSAHMSKLRFTKKTYSYIGDVPVFDMADRPISDWNLVFKWLFDKVVALGALILLSPVMIATAIAIKLTSKGPVLFRQRRYGFNNELIEIYKFRSMYTELSDVTALRLVTKDDPRVTPVGRIIRRTSIDELPQLFNVLKGQLSIVGPRPHALQAKAANKLYHEAVDGYFARHKVKPGITGWAQIHGWRGETDTLEKIMQRVDHDLYYIEHWSLFLDIYILLMTPVSLFTKSENAF